MVTKPVKIFFSYSHRDEALRDELVKHLGILKRQGIIQAWHDRQIVAGHPWEDEINAHLNSAEVILLLISADFIASDYCYGIELQRAMQRHARGEAQVIPVILRPVDWQSAPFYQLQALPRGAKPITQWMNQDEAFMTVAQGIRTVVEEISQRDNLPKQQEQFFNFSPQKLPRHRSPLQINQTVLSISMIVIGWLLAGLISSGSSFDGSAISQQIAITGAVGGFVNGLSISMRLRLIERSDFQKWLPTIAGWTICNAFWGFIVGRLVEPGAMRQLDGIFSVMIPGIATGVLFLVWQLKQAHYS